MNADEHIESRKRVAHSWREFAIAWAPALVWALAIFYVSAQNTWTVFEGPPLVKALRKSGHVFEYAVLAGRILSLV